MQRARDLGRLIDLDVEDEPRLAVLLRDHLDLHGDAALFSNAVVSLWSNSSPSKPASMRRFADVSLPACCLASSLVTVAKRSEVHPEMKIMTLENEKNEKSEIFRN